MDNAALSASDAPTASGIVFRKPLMYDFMLSLVWGPAEHRYRRRLLDLATVREGDCVLDVGCGTGTLAIAARRRVGAAGAVHAIDPSPQMIARAGRKAAAAGAAVDLRVAAAEHLPFPASAFDAVLSTTVIHCLAEAGRGQAISEMRRVLRPGGRLLIVDFGGSPEAKTSFVGRMRAHRSFDLERALPNLREAGFEHVEAGQLDFSDLHFVRAIAR